MTTHDPHRPVLHLRPPCNWVNDPNGPVFHQGAYHLFFQYNPSGVRHANMHWGHWRSDDLLHWQLLPIALAPTRDGADADGVWSGNTVSTGDQIVAFYAANRRDRWWQPVAFAVSTDGVRFEKGAQFLIPEPPSGTVMFRDPYVWRDGDRWRMLVGASLEDGRGAAIHYISDDLEVWDEVGPFLARAPEPLPGGRDTEEGWECVQYAALTPDRGALVFSAWDSEEGAGSAAVYVGHDDGVRFDTQLLQVFDHGPDCYAPAVMQTPDGRWLAWSWIWEARDEPRVGAPSTWTDEVGWAGMLSLPRELTLTDRGLHQAVAHEINQLRGRQLLDRTSSVAEGHPIDLGEIPQAVDLIATLGRSEDGSAAAALRVNTSADGAEHLDLGLDPDTGHLVLDRTDASRDPRAKQGAWQIPTAVPPGGSIDVRAVIDHSVIEVFTSDGQTLTLRFYPTGTTDWRLVAFSHGSGEATVAATAWELTPLPISILAPEEGNAA